MFIFCIIFYCGLGFCISLLEFFVDFVVDIRQVTIFKMTYKNVSLSCTHTLTLSYFVRLNTLCSELIAIICSTTTVTHSVTNLPTL